MLGPLIEARPAHIAIANRTPDKAQALVQRHAALAAQTASRSPPPPLDAAGSPFIVVVNGTATSLTGAGVPVPASVLRPGTLAVDMMYGPAAQAFMDGRAHGAVPRDGLGMLVEQAAEVLCGVARRAPAAQVLAELRAMLERPHEPALRLLGLLLAAVILALFFAGPGSR